MELNLQFEKKKISRCWCHMMVSGSSIVFLNAGSQVSTISMCCHLVCGFQHGFHSIFWLFPVFYTCNGHSRVVHTVTMPYSFLYVSWGRWYLLFQHSLPSFHCGKFAPGGGRGSRGPPSDMAFSIQLEFNMPLLRCFIDHTEALNVPHRVDVVFLDTWGEGSKNQLLELKTSCHW